VCSSDLVNRTPFVIIVRPGNPKAIREFADLGRPGVRIVHPDPLTSGAANWAIVAEYGAGVRRPGGGPEAGRAVLRGVWRNVVAQGGSARAARTQFDHGFGDALITYEQDAISSLNRPGAPFEIVYPPSTILSEHTVVVPARRGSREQQELVRAFVDFLFGEEAQRLFVRAGFRSFDERLNTANRTFGVIADPFLISDFGGWGEAKRSIVDRIWKNGVLKELHP
jgi:sulfate transport system substrate-binding protein